jgi:desulfoferrodoxin-like iron-binding protein
MIPELGKRFRCDTCGAQVICLAAGTGELRCCGESMVRNDAKPLPAAD